MKLDNHLGKNSHSVSFQEYRATMDRLKAQLEREASERKARKEAKKRG